MGDLAIVICSCSLISVRRGLGFLRPFVILFTSHWSILNVSGRLSSSDGKKKFSRSFQQGWVFQIQPGSIFYKFICTYLPLFYIETNLKHSYGTSDWQLTRWICSLLEKNRVWSTWPVFTKEAKSNGNKINANALTKNGNLNIRFAEICSWMPFGDTDSLELVVIFNFHFDFVLK